MCQPSMDVVVRVANLVGQIRRYRDEQREVEAACRRTIPWDINQDIYPHSELRKHSRLLSCNESFPQESEMADWLASAAGVSSQTVRGVWLCRNAGAGTLRSRLHRPFDRRPIIISRNTASFLAHIWVWPTFGSCFRFEPGARHAYLSIHTQSMGTFDTSLSTPRSSLIFSFMSQWLSLVTFRAAIPLSVCYSVALFSFRYRIPTYC